MGKWDTPPGGDFVRYVEELSRQSPLHAAHREATAEGVDEPAPRAAPGSIGAGNAAAVAAARRAAAARSGQAAVPPVSNASAPALSAVPTPAAVWQALRVPVFAYIGLEVVAAFVPLLRPFSVPALFLCIAWAVWRVFKLVGGSAGWQRASQQIAEEIRKQQHNNRRG